MHMVVIITLHSSTGMEMANLSRLLALTLQKAQGDHLWYK